MQRRSLTPKEMPICFKGGVGDSYLYFSRMDKDSVLFIYLLIHLLVLMIGDCQEVQIISHSVTHL